MNDNDWAVMDTRPPGASGTCQTCRYWSDRLAQSIGGGSVEAYCFGPGGPQQGKYTTGRMRCAKHENGAPIDAPDSAGAADVTRNKGD